MSSLRDILHRLDSLSESGEFAGHYKTGPAGQLKAQDHVGPDGARGRLVGDSVEPQDQAVQEYMPMPEPLTDDTVMELSAETLAAYRAAALKDKQFNFRGIAQANQMSRSKQSQKDWDAAEEWDDEARFFRSVNAKRNRGIRRADRSMAKASAAGSDVAEGDDDLVDLGPALRNLTGEFNKFMKHDDRMKTDPAYAKKWNKRYAKYAGNNDTDKQGVAEGFPQPGDSSGKAKQFNPNAKIQTREMTLDQILSSVKGIPYVNDVIQDWDAKDYSWGVTKKVIEYAEYLQKNPQSVANLPPLVVIDGQLNDGAHRLSAITLLQKRMDPKNPLWKQVKLKVNFGTSADVMSEQGLAEGTKTATEDVVSRDGKNLGDYLQDVAKIIKKDPELLDRVAQELDKLGPAVKTLHTDDGHEIKIHGNEDDGFRISIKNKTAKGRFRDLDEARMAVELFVARRRKHSADNSDYVDEK